MQMYVHISLSERRIIIRGGGEGGERREKGVHVFMSCIHALLYRRESTCKNITIYNVYA